MMNRDFSLRKFEDLVAKATSIEEGPGAIPQEEWETVELAVKTFQKNDSWNQLLELRDIFTPILARDSIWGIYQIQLLDRVSIEAARQSNDHNRLGHYQGARGHNLHRQGFHREAIKTFSESVNAYNKTGNDFAALKSFYMTSLCYRALGNRTKAKEILEKVLSLVPEDNNWRGNPLQVVAWISQDEGNLIDSEKYLRKALFYHRKLKGSDILEAGALADLGEIVGILNRSAEAEELFLQSLALLDKHKGQYNRQVARTLLKYAQYLMNNKKFKLSLELLNDADGKAGGIGHYYDLLWRIEMTRAIVYFRTKNILSCFRRIRLVFRYRKAIGLPPWLLIKQLLTRMATDTGLPR